VTDLIRQILTTTTYRRLDVEAVIDPKKESWCTFDPEIGYVPRDIVLKDGMDFARTTYTHERHGQRKMVNYPGRPCRINTYGDSFTQSQQVSDDESWQERLAAHLGEPIRNFGCGGHSVFTAYRRALRMESGECSADYVILTIYDDDHVRNLDASRWLRTQWNEKDRPRDRAWPLHGLPWSHLRFDLAKGQFAELPSLCQKPQDLLALTEREHFHHTFHDDQILRLFVLELGGEARFDDLEQVAEALGIKVNLRPTPGAGDRKAEAGRLRKEYGFKSTEYILDKFLPWLAQRGKKLLVPLAYGESQILNYLKGGQRFDTVFLDYLNRKGIKYFDTLEEHKKDFADFGVTPEKYIDRYYIKPAAAAVFGHYNPLGNLFFAMSIKNDLVAWLDPKPPAYR
jgi:hypothetical protein